MQLKHFHLRLTEKIGLGTNDYNLVTVWYVSPTIILNKNPGGLLLAARIILFARKKLADNLYLVDIKGLCSVRNLNE